MIRSRRRATVLALAAAASAVALSPLPASAAPAAPAATPDVAAGFVQTNLVSDIPGKALHTDPLLKNAWGLAFGPGSPLWIADNTTGVSTLYDGTGTPQPQPNRLVVTIPAPPSAGPRATGTPTGTVFNSSGGGFPVVKGAVSGPSRFLFVTEDGTIAGWNPQVDPTHAELAVDRSKVTDPAGDTGALYKGLTMATTKSGSFLYATNFRFGQVEVFDSSFTPVTTFTDPRLPRGFAPFGIQNLGGNLYVTFAKQDAGKKDDVAGPGNGFVDEFSPTGDLIRRFASRGALNSPWGIAQAPATFGAAAGDVLVGNFGNGRIDVFRPSDGRFVGQLRGSTGGPITIPGLWDLHFPTGALNVAPGVAYFTAGPNGENDGLLGTVAPVVN